MTEKPTTAAAAVANLVPALGLPMRIRILNALTSSPGSWSSLTKQFEAESNSVFYHVTALEKGGVVEEGSTGKIRGATERTYRLRPPASRMRFHKPCPAGRACPIRFLPGHAGE